MTSESGDECEVAYILDEEDDEDEDDDDYIPGKRDSDSDPDYGKKPKKAKTTPKKGYVPGKRGRPPSASKPPPSSGRGRGRPRKEKPAEKGDEDVEEVIDIDASPSKNTDSTPKKKVGVKRKSPNKATVKSPKEGPKVAKSPSTKSPKTKAPRPKKQKRSSCSDDMDESSSYQRRSSRCSTSRAISYADADVSEEDMFEDEDLMEAFRRSKEDSKKDEMKKQHVDELWSKFKTDVDEKDKVKEKAPIAKPNTESTVKSPLVVLDIKENGKSTELKNENEQSNGTNDRLASGNGTCETSDASIAKTGCEKNVTPETIGNSKPNEEVKKDTNVEVVKKEVVSGNDNNNESEGQIANDQGETTEQHDKSSGEKVPSNEISDGGKTTNAKFDNVKASDEKSSDVKPNNEPLGEKSINKESVDCKLTPSSTDSKATNSESTIENPAEKKIIEPSSTDAVKTDSKSSDSKPYSEQSAITKSSEEITVADKLVLEKPIIEKPTSEKSYPEEVKSEKVQPENSKKDSIINELAETSKMDDSLKGGVPTRSPGINKFLTSGVKKTGGLSSVLNTIEKKKKQTVLDKTKNDWESYKSEEDIEEELKGNRNSGYLDRQEFLQRVDVKQWENEREMRLYSNRK